MHILGRRLLRRPVFTAVVVATSALTVTLAAAAFAIVDGLLFRGLPYEQPDRLYLVSIKDQPTSVSARRPSLGEADAAIRLGGEGRLAVARTDFGIGPLAGDEGRETTWAAEIDDTFFDVLGQGPLVGGFTAEDHHLEPRVQGPWRTRPVIISYRLWDRVFGRNVAAVGATVTASEGTFRIVGVLPEDFAFPALFGRTAPDVLLPLSTSAPKAFPGIPVLMLARVDDRNVLPAVAGRVQTAVDATATTGRDPNRRVILDQAVAVLGANQRTPFTFALGAALAVVLLGIVNVVGLFHARIAERRQELLTMIALGSGASRVVGLFLAEATVLGVVAGVLGGIASRALLPWLVGVLPERWVLIKPPAIDLRALIVAVVIGTVATQAAACVAMAVGLRLRGGQLVSTRYSAFVERRRLTFLACQAALGVLVAFVAISAVLNLYVLWSEETGFARNGLAIIDLRVASDIDSTRAPIVLDRAEEIARRHVPAGTEASVEGRWLRNMRTGSRYLPPQGHQEVPAEDVLISRDFFRTAGIPIVAGRELSDGEIAAAAPAMVVSKSLAQAYWGDAAAAIGAALSDGKTVAQVVGVAADAKVVGLEDAAQEIYLPAASRSRGRLRVLVIRADGDARAKAREVASAIRQEMPEVFVTRADSDRAALLAAGRGRQFDVIVFGIFGLTALTLFAVGVFAAVLVTVSTRRRDTCIRLALGASTRRIQVGLLREVLLALGGGAILGTIGCLWFEKAVTAMFSTSVASPHVSVTVAPALIVLLGVLATWLASRGLVRSDPARIVRDA